MNQTQIFKNFIEQVCNKVGCAEAAAPLQKGFDALCEAEGKKHRASPYVAQTGYEYVKKKYGWGDDLESFWDWVDDHYDTFVKAWNATDSVEEGIDAIYNAEEDDVMRAEIAML